MRDKEKVAKWMIERSFATGHGDSIEDLLKEIEWQIESRTKQAYCDGVESGIDAEREACAKLCDHWPYGRDDLWSLGQAIRARGEK